MTFTPASISTPTKLFFTSVAIAVLYILSAKVGLLLAVIQKNATPVWPPSGIAIAAMLIFGYRIWPGIFIGALLVNLMTELPIVTATLIASGNTLEAIAAVFLVLRLIGTPNPFSRAPDYFWFVIAACMISPCISATTGVTSLAISDELSWAGFGQVWGIWWAGDAVGALVVTPLLMSWCCKKLSVWQTKRVIEAVLLISLTGLVSYVIFSDLLIQNFSKILIGFSLMPLLIWSSFRFNLQGTSFLIFLVSVISILGTAQGFGPFNQQSVSDSVILLQGFIAIVSLTTVTLSIIIGESERTESILQRAHDEPTNTGEEFTRQDSKSKNDLEYINAAWRSLSENSPDHIMLLDTEGKILFINHAAPGLATDQVIGHSVYEFIPPDNSQEMLACYTKVLKTGEPGQFEAEYLANNDSYIYDSRVGAVKHDNKIVGLTVSSRDISERINSEQKIKDSQAMLETVINTIPVRVFWKDTNGNFLGCNQMVAEDAGLKSPNELIGKSDFDFFTEENASHFQNDDKKIMKSGIPKMNYEEAQTTPEGQTIYLETSKIPLRNSNDNLIGILGTYKDITERKRVEQITAALAKQSSALSSGDNFFEECLRNLAEFYNTKFAFIGLVSDKAKTHIESYLVLADSNIVKNFEYDLVGTPCQDVLNNESNYVASNVAKIYPDDQMLVDMELESYYGASLTLPSGEVFGLVVVTDPSPLLLESWAKPILEIYATRISIEMERKRTDEELTGMADTMSYQATHDPLTDLINRREFEARLQTALKIAKLEDHQHALCYLDLDQFKVVNDTCGHIAGDELLKQLSTKLVSSIRNNDTIGRLGGDEFGVLLQDCPIEKAISISENILNVVKDFRFVWKDKLFEIGVSMGVVPITSDTYSINQALSAADASCYLAKEHGRNRIHIYQENDTEIAQRHGEMQIVSEISQALEEDRFVLYFQSIVPLMENKDNQEHYEVLIRMHDRNQQLIPPGTFIGAAERYNLMPSLDRWVIKTSFKHLSQKYKDNKFENILCAINLSGTTLSDDKFIEFMHEMLSEFNLPPEIICFEITETAAITNISKAMQFISRFKEMGFQFALDDFGAGLSSYSYLKNLPVDYLKIDGSFVSGISSDPLNRSIVESINQVGHTMGIKTIAEWVDSEEVRQTLIDIGVDYAQGFSINKPEPLK